MLDEIKITNTSEIVVAAQRAVNSNNVRETYRLAQKLTTFKTDSPIIIANRILVTTDVEQMDVYELFYIITV